MRRTPVVAVVGPTAAGKSELAVALALAVAGEVVNTDSMQLYRGMDIGDHINLRGTEWTVVGVFAGSDSLGDSVLRADADTVMSTFGRTTYQQVINEFIADMRKQCHDNAIDYQLISTATPLDQALASYLSWRG